jgi:hypothetical protein
MVADILRGRANVRLISCIVDRGASGCLCAQLECRSDSIHPNYKGPGSTIGISGWINAWYKKGRSLHESVAFYNVYKLPASE